MEFILKYYVQSSGDIGGGAWGANGKCYLWSQLVTFPEMVKKGQNYTSLYQYNKYVQSNQGHNKSEKEYDFHWRLKITNIDFFVCIFFNIILQRYMK